MQVVLVLRDYEAPIWALGSSARVMGLVDDGKRFGIDKRMKRMDMPLKAQAIRLLAIGDVHLGTRPVNLDTILQGPNSVSLSALTPESALASVVDLAIRLQVDGVVFAGDVVESTNARFEALRPLEQAVKCLVDAEIRVLGVGGNHDVEALPRLAKTIDGFEFLGAGGQWERATFSKAQGPTVDLLGWSFPEPKVRTSPLAALLKDLPQRSQSSAVQIGIVHGDLDGSHGVYAPFSSREIRDTQFAAWFLGHIHKPSLQNGPIESGIATYGYLGSLTGLTRRETGPHGPWLVEISPQGEIELTQQVIAPLRWEHRDLKLDPEDDVTTVGDRIVDVMEDIARQIQETGHQPLVLGLRLRLTGSSRHEIAIRREMGQKHWQEMNRIVGGTFVFVDRVLDGLEAFLDLRKAATGNDPISILAQDLLHLEAGGRECQVLLQAARARLKETANHSRWSPLRESRDYEDPLAHESLRQLMIQSARQAIRVLLQQRGQGAKA